MTGQSATYVVESLRWQTLSSLAESLRTAICSQLESSAYLIRRRSRSDGVVGAISGHRTQGRTHQVAGLKAVDSSRRADFLLMLLHCIDSTAGQGAWDFHLWWPCNRNILPLCIRSSDTPTKHHVQYCTEYNRNSRDAGSFLFLLQCRTHQIRKSGPKSQLVGHWAGRDWDLVSTSLSRAEEVCLHHLLSYLCGAKLVSERKWSMSCFAQLIEIRCVNSSGNAHNLVQRQSDLWNPGQSFELSVTAVFFEPHLPQKPSYGI